MTATAKPPKMTARDVLGALHAKWPDAEYLKIEEAPQDAGRQGRKIDLLVVSLWTSRGHEVDAVEVKVSTSDLKREIDNAAKADWWWRHCTRFWLAVPTALEERARQDLPEAWGLVVCDGDRTKIAVRAPKHEREPFTWQTMIGLMRASADAGAGALMRAENRGYELGHQRGVAEGKLQTEPGRAGRALEQLQARVAAFEEAAGIKIDQHRPDDLGRRLAVLLDWAHDPASVDSRLRQAIGNLSNAAKAMEEIRRDFVDATTPSSTP